MNGTTRSSNRRSPARCPGPDRREVLRIGGLSALGLGLTPFLEWKRVMAQRPGDTPAAAAQSCILIWLDGGPSHLETFDPKPEAAPEVRGPLGTIETTIPGVRLNECLPEMARRMDDWAIIRSMTSPLGEHNFGTHYLQTGFQPTPALEYPAFHAVATHVQQSPASLPGNIAVPDFRVGGSRFSGHGFLNPSTAPFSLGRDPSKPGFRVQDLDLRAGLTLSRLQRRRAFVQQLDQWSGLAEGPADPMFEQAFRLITSPEAKRAFDLSEETEATRQRYGRRTVGASCLLARRLVQRGVPFVTVNHRGWDTHADLTTRIRDGFAGARQPVGLVPSLDQALAALLDDLRQEDLLDQTLVLVMGEFGRTPKLNAAGGRDHWPRVFSVAAAGGGVRGGQVIGSSDAIGESPRDRPVTPSDLIATVYRQLGIDPAMELTTPDGRPIRLTPAEARIVDELVG